MTRHSFQQGYVSDPIKTRRGVAFKIRYRIRTADGKWKHKSETLYGISGKKTARTVLNQRIKQSSNQTVEATEITLSQFVKIYWEPYLNRKNVKPATKSGYQSVLECHLFPEMGDMQLQDITPLHIENLVSKKERQNLSPKSIRNILVVLQGIFHVAVDNDLIQRPPIRKSHKPDYRRMEKPVWSAEQIKLIIENSPSDYKSLFNCIAMTGLRIGELLALQWKHIDPDSRTIKVEQSLWRGQIVSPKTSGSIRTLPYGEILGEVLANHRRQTSYGAHEDYVFCKGDGSPLNPDVLRKDVLYPILDRLQISRPKRGAGFHSFRHSAASLINQRTGNLKLAQGLLGHSNLSTTADTYTHTSSEAQREASEVLEQEIFGDLFPIVPKTGNRNNSFLN